MAHTKIFLRKSETRCHNIISPPKDENTKNSKSPTQIYDASIMHKAIRQTILTKLIATIPYPLWEKMAKPELVVPYYHLVSDEEVLHVKHLYKYKNTRQFQQDIDFLANRFTVIGLTDLLRHLDSGTPLPQKALLFTFDDGLREIYDIVAPMLLQRGISATIFVSSGFLDNKKLFFKHKASILADYFQHHQNPKVNREISAIFHKYGIKCNKIYQGILSITFANSTILDEAAELIGYDFGHYLQEKKPYLTSDQIQRLLSQGFTIGAHSIDHPSYSALSFNQQLFQTVKSIEVIKNRFNLAYRVFSFPYSDHLLSKTLFTNLFSSGKIDISFGNQGFRKDEFPANIQRINLEKQALPAPQQLAYEYAKKIYNGFRRKECVQRPS